MPVNIRFKPDQSFYWQDTGKVAPGEIGSFVDLSGYRPSRIAIHCHEEDAFALVYRLERPGIEPNEDTLTQERILGRIAFAAIERRIITLQRTRGVVRLEHGVDPGKTTPKK
jgi:hypothetical protein